MGKGYSIRAAAKGEAEIFIYEDVGESWFGGVSAKQFATDLRGLGNVTTINLRLNSYGGDVFDGLAIYRLLADHKAKVIAHVDGIAASIASVIAMAGDEIRIAEAGEIMIHDAWGVAIGPAAEIRSLADRLEAVSASIADVYVARTGNTKDQVQAWMLEEKTFQSTEAHKFNFASAIVPNVRAAARAGLPAMHWRARSAQRAATPPAEVIRPRYDAQVERIARLRAHATLARRA